ncbi:unnamed protein product [Rotaria sordida]|uniref:Uncharacterized protein n=1 Tax=Rotaria sordida TaxID=392033 RepID=A0A814IXZ9_9BILA|nr:unnamed protein product [Rotaria sordida]CAF4161850.1 unnamed protein product [Rotaria sordida]
MYLHALTSLNTRILSILQSIPLHVIILNSHFGREIYFLSSHLIFHGHQVVSLYIYDTIRDRSSSISLLFNQHQFINLQSCIFMSVNPSTKLENVIKQVESSNRLISFTIKQPNDKNMNENNKWDLTRTILIHKSSYLRSVVLKYPYDYVDVSNYISIVSNTTSLNLLIIRYLYTIIKHEVLFQNNNCLIETPPINENDLPISPQMTSFDSTIFAVCDSRAIAYILRCMPNLIRFIFLYARC